MNYDDLYYRKRVDGIKRIRNELGYPLREAVDIYTAFDGDIDRAIANTKRSRDTVDYVSTFRVIGYKVITDKFPNLHGLHHSLTEVERLQLASDPNAEIIEMVSKEEADASNKIYQRAKS
jgi:hypothetical protein